jgi:hypothetical protein
MQHQSTVRCPFVAKSIGRKRKAGASPILRSCDFTRGEVLSDELAVSELSGRRYRKDEVARSGVTSKLGHRSEFIQCAVTLQTLAAGEAEQCESTGQRVRPGVLERCAVSGLAVVPSELDRCAASRQKALKRFMVTSCVSGARLIEGNAIVSVGGKFCLPSETEQCVWSGVACHPEDIRVCDLTGVPHHTQYSAGPRPFRLRALVALLDGVSRRTDEVNLWDKVAERARPDVGKCTIEAAELSLDARHLAVSGTRRTWGLWTQQVGYIFSMDGGTIVGRVAIGQRGTKGWAQKAA